MIIDSHAHYNNGAYKKPFRYLSHDQDGYTLREGDREQLFRELMEADIPYSIEPGVSLQSCGEVLEPHPRLDRVWDIGLHQFPEKLFPVALPEGISILAISQVPKLFLICVIVVMCVGVDDHGSPSFLVYPNKSISRVH